ncbi:MAG: hypothetical protein AB7O37_19235 [Vicinamibacteria bacterium]
MPESPLRRELICGTAIAGLLAATRPGSARDYASAGEVFEAIDAREAEVDARLAALAAALPAARAFAEAVARDHARHRQQRARWRSKLGLPAATPAAPSAVDRDLAALRAAMQELVHAHAEGLPALGSERAVDALARQMVTLARHLAVVDLWLEAEQARG